MIFIILSLDTLGLYPFWQVIVIAEERNRLLREIRDDQQKRRDGGVYVGSRFRSMDDSRP